MPSQRIQKLIEMIDKHQDDVYLYYALGTTYLEEGNLIEAENWFKKVLQLEPDNIAAHYQLGILLHKRGVEKEAITLFEHGLKLANIKGDLKTVNDFKTAIEEILF
ncbi:MAG: tetratricopeptide repeat protein [Bacteroidia bacterium]|nr:tetratricopeptide repeat protein [Bacteroidia bacterium]